MELARGWAEVMAAQYFACEHGGYEPMPEDEEIVKVSARAARLAFEELHSSAQDELVEKAYRRMEA